MNLFRLLICAFPLFAIGSCQSMVFSKKQLDFTSNMSSQLNGCKVSLSVNAASGTSGTYKNYVIGIEGLPSTDSTNMEANLMLASSLPAYMFYTDTIADRKSYKYIEVVVKVNEKEYTTRYTPDQLAHVDECAYTAAAYIRAVKEVNIDSLRYYSDTSTIDNPTLFSMADKLKVANTKWGETQRHTTCGFRLGEREGKPYIFYKFNLHRETVVQEANFWIDPATKKVIGYSL